MRHYGKERRQNVPIFYPTVHHFYPFSFSQYNNLKINSICYPFICRLLQLSPISTFPYFFSAHTGQNIHSTHNKSQQNQSNSKIHSIKRKTKKIQKDKNLGLVYIKPRYPSKMTFNYIDFTWWGNLRLYFALTWSWIWFFSSWYNIFCKPIKL